MSNKSHIDNSVFPDGKPILKHTVTFRSRYGETDKMGYLYHARYIDYFDVARTEMIRSTGLDYKTLEDSGIIMPVLDVQVRYCEPVYYDEEVQVLVHIYDWPLTRFYTHYKVSSSTNALKAYGKVTLCFVEEHFRKPVKAPELLLEALRKNV